MIAAVLADDFTGANDCAASFAAAGFSAYAALEGGMPGLAPDVFVQDTETRFSSPAEAKQAVALAWAGLRGKGRLLDYQRMDSTLRGNPGEEILGLLGASGARRLAFCAAYPLHGRAIRKGVVTVRGQRLNESEYAKDPLSPSRSAEPARLFPPGLARAIGRHCLSGLRGYIRASRQRILCFDASEDRDLKIIAKACLAEGIRHFAGASGLSAALARELSQGPAMRAPRVPRRRAIVAGTVSQTSLAQLDALEASGLAACFDLESGRLPPRGPARFALASLRTRRQLRMGRDAAGRRAWAEARLKRLVDEALRLGGPPASRLWMLTGGHTATTFYRSLGLEGNWVRGALAPGLALLEASGKKGLKVFTCSKPGGFGTEDTMQRFMLAGKNS